MARTSKIFRFSATQRMAVIERSAAEIPVVVSTQSMDTVNAVFMVICILCDHLRKLQFFP